MSEAHRYIYYDFPLDSCSCMCTCTNDSNDKVQLILTLCLLTDYSFCFDTKKLGIVHCTYLVVSGYKFQTLVYAFV